MAHLHATVTAHLKGISVDRVDLPAGIPVQRAIAELRRDPAVQYAEPDYIVRILDVDDPFLRMQWDLKLIDAPAAWGITTGSPNVLVAMLDTGIQFNHPDLAGQIAGSKNFIGLGPATDLNGHGTHTAGTVAAKTDNHFGIASLGYQTRLLIGKVVNDQGNGDLLTVASGVDWAVQSGAKVISMSLGTPSFSQTMQDAINEAWDHGLVVVAAAGNTGTNQPIYPAACHHCIAVAATDDEDVRASFSSFGSWVHVAAPGKNILSLFKGSSYAILSGTSMAAPHVAALAALLWANGARSNATIRIAIENSGDPTTGFNHYPVQRINARRALLRLP